MSTFRGKVRTLFALAGAVLAVALLPRPAAAWGDEGHKVICEIAFRLVQPSTRAEIQRLIKYGHRVSSLLGFLHMA